MRLVQKESLCPAWGGGGLVWILTLNSNQCGQQRNSTKYQQATHGGLGWGGVQVQVVARGGGGGSVFTDAAANLKGGVTVRLWVELASRSYREKQVGELTGAELTCLILHGVVGSTGSRGRGGGGTRCGRRRFSHRLAGLLPARTSVCTDTQQLFPPLSTSSGTFNGTSGVSRVIRLSL